MRTAFFSDYQLLGPNGVGLQPGLAAGPCARLAQAPLPARDWQDELTRHQAIYEELLASPDWTGHPAPLSPASRQRAPSARDLTRDLAGWSPPQLGRRPTTNS